MNKYYQVIDNDISDGYHTFGALYEHRGLLFINLVLIMGGGILKRDHFEGWDCIYLELPTGQISYHVSIDLRPLYVGKIKEDPGYEYDGHSSQDVIKRLSLNAGLRK